MQKVYTEIRSIIGNVVTVRAEGVRNGDLALVGDSYASVIKLDKDIVSLQVFAGAQGVSTTDPVRFLGRPMMVSFSKNLLGRIFDGIEYRGYEQSVVEELAAESGVPVWNGLTDIDHPTQSLADALHIIHEMGGVENLKGKKIAMSWAYSPSYGKPLSVPQGIIGLLTRFGMDVVLAHPEGYEVMGDVVEVAKKNAAESGGKFTVTNDMKEAFKDADVVYPKSWAPFAAMEVRTDLYGKGDFDGIDKLEKELLAQNAQHQDWLVDDEMMKLTKNGLDTLYMHPLPADIQGISCEHGEVTAEVFDRARDSLYKEASNKPYVIAAMIFLAKVKDPVSALKALDEADNPRVTFKK